MSHLALILIASFFSVFLLALNSQFNRDRLAIRCALMSWLISVMHFVTTRLIAVTPDDAMLMLFFASATGSSLGMYLSVKFYCWLNPKDKGK